MWSPKPCGRTPPLTAINSKRGSARCGPSVVVAALTTRRTSSSTAGGHGVGAGDRRRVYHETLAELYAYFIPCLIELLHKSNCDHIALVAALRAGAAGEAVEIARKHVDILHRTMFMGLTEGGTHSS